jgi:hypothetical protein
MKALKSLLYVVNGGLIVANATMYNLHHAPVNLIVSVFLTTFVLVYIGSEAINE